MNVSLPDDVKAVIDGPVFATVATIQPDGSPQMSLVWIKRDGDDLVFSTNLGRRKELNMRRDPRISVLLYSAQSPYSYAEIRGTAEISTHGGRELIDQLSLKYTGHRYADFDHSVDEAAEGLGPRVVVRVCPHRIVGTMLAAPVSGSAV